MSLATSISNVVKRHLATFSEVEAHDTVCRRNLSPAERRAKPPWIMMGRSELQQEEFELWRAFDVGEINETELLSRMRALMAAYYSSSDGTEVDLVFIGTRVSFHRFFAAVITKLGGLVSPPKASAVSDPAYPLAVQTTYMALFYVCTKRGLSLQRLQVLRELAVGQLSGYWGRVHDTLGAHAWLSAHLSSPPDHYQELDAWENEVRETLKLEAAGAPFAKDNIYRSIESRARFELETPFDREKFYGQMFEGVLGALMTKNIDFNRMGLQSDVHDPDTAQADATFSEESSGKISMPLDAQATNLESQPNDEPLVFTSYGTPFSDHHGSRSINDLPRAEQDELIKVTFDPEGDMHGLVISRDVLRSEAQGLWISIVRIGSILEQRGLINEFDERSPREIEKIVQVFDKTLLGPRLREALTDVRGGTNNFDWKQLTALEQDELFDECETLSDVSNLLQQHLGKSKEGPGRSIPPAASDTSPERETSGLGRGNATEVLSASSSGLDRFSSATILRGNFSLVEFVGFVLFGVVGPIRYGTADASIFKFLLYLALASFALAFASWMWNPRMAVIKSGGWRNFPFIWALRFLHVTLVGGFLYGLTRSMA